LFRWEGWADGAFFKASLTFFWKKKSEGIAHANEITAAAAAARGAIITYFNADSRSYANIVNTIKSIAAGEAARGTLVTVRNTAFTRRTSVVGRAALAVTCATLATISIAALQVASIVRTREWVATDVARGAISTLLNADYRSCAYTAQAIESSAAVAARANFIFWKTAYIIGRTNGVRIAALAVTRAALVTIGIITAPVIDSIALEWVAAYAARGAISTLSSAAFTGRTSVVRRAALRVTRAALNAIIIAAPVSRTTRARESRAAAAHGASDIYFNTKALACTARAFESIAAVAVHRAIFTIWNAAYANGRTRNDLANGVVRAALPSVLVIGATLAAFDTILIAALKVTSISSWLRAHRILAAHGRAKLAGVPTCLETTVFVIKLKESSDRA
jgi:hypothetical protein